MAEFNSTEKEYRRDVLVHHLVEQQVQRNPEALAVAFNDEHLTYAQLNQRSNRLANYLRSTGIVPGSLVAICMERSLEMVISVVAILKSGAAYVPLDPEYPKDRLAFMLEDSQAAVVLTQERIRGELDFGSTPVLCVDSAWNEISRHHAENPKNLATPEDLVYVIYTSGSTGKPKGVCLPHRCLTNLLYWQLESSQAVVGDRTLQFTSLSFDVSFQEIFSTLSSGGALVLISESTRRDGRALLKYLKEHSVGRLFQPFVALQQIAEAAYEEDDLPISLREVITAGEQLKVTQQIASFFERLPGCKLFNHYGPSETHVVTSYELSGNPVSWETLPAIGKPIANTQIFILDSNRNPVPLGVSGELYVGGLSLARGYLRRPELTNERFVGNPFSTNSNDVLYRTGDLCRYLPDGNIQYLGRIDNQVKFRGYRIELGEIESALAKHSAVQQSAVILREDLPGDKRLVAYVVPRNGAINAPELRSHLKQTLPEYMVPSAFVQMEALPLTPSGKLSRRQLPVPEWDNTPSAAAAPRNPIEELLLGIWNDILRRKGFGVEDNFFDLGGHSLLATQLISRIRRTLQMDLPLRIVFEHPTIRELAHDIGIGRRASDADNSPRLVRRPRPTKAGEEPVFPLSFAEQRLWMLDRLDQNSSAYNLSVGLRLQGSLQVAALEHSWNEILRRHEVLRARFRFHGEQPEQVIAPEQPVSLPLTDLSDRANPEKEALELVRRESQKPFNLATGPLWRASLLKLAADEHVLLINVHHAVFDGWSGGVLLRELVAHYSAFVTGTPSRLPEPEIQYTDFAVWQREYLSGERLQRQVNYWKQQLEGAPGYIDLPADHSRPQKQRFHGSQLRLTIPADLSSKLKQVAQKNEATLFMTLLSAFSVLLARYSGQDDVVVGSPIAGRTHAETENLIGFFVNTIPLRAKVAGDSTFKQLLTSVRETTLNAYTYQDLPFEKLVEEIKPERDLSRNPIFQVMFALQNLPSETTELPELTLSPFRAGSAVNSKFDLSLMAVEQGDSISSVFEYNTDLFEAATIERMSRSFHALLTAIAENPNRALSDFPLLRDPLQVIPRTEPLRTSLAQERLWFVDQLEPQSPLHNLPLVLRLTGPLDVRALRNSLNRILARHECLRTWFKSNKAGAPVQMITPALEVDLRVNSVTSVPERVRETEARQLVSAEVNSSFDLGTGPLIRVLLVKI
ncbi:MAG TPA: amino acid adenylation domain-containing protein, partial [Terriglobales bacterium]|nr:amino acid adenylation domain-containing protein [Terriglobales bacterium]